MRTGSCEVVVPGELGPGERKRWEALQHAAPSLASPFLSATFAVHVGAVRRDARVAVLHGSGSPDGIVGFLPYHVGPTRVGRSIGRTLATAQGAVVEPAADWDPQAVVRGCGLRVMTFELLVEDQPALRPFVSSTQPSPQVDLTGGFAAYLQAARRLGRGGPKEAAKRRRQFERTAELRFTFDDRDPAALRTLLAWKSAQYVRTGSVDWAGRPWVAELLERLHASDAPDCAGVLSTLRAGGAVVAAQFSLRSGDHLAGWVTAYAPDEAGSSPGSVLQLFLLEAAADAGIRVFDLAAGAEPYKARWATGEQPRMAAVVPGGRVGTALGTVARAGWGLARRTPLRESAARWRARLDVR